MTTVTVLIPAHNAARQIARTVVSVRTQTRQADRILVAADNCSDDTAARARAAGADVVEVSGGSKAKCQNAALPFIDTDLVLPLDDDTVLAPDYLEKLLPVFDDPAVAVAAGCVLTLRQSHWAAKARMLEYLQSFHFYRPVQAISDSVVVCAGCCSVFRVADLHAIGGFPETTLTEDIDYTLGKHTERRRAIYVHGAVAYAEEPDSLRLLRTQLKRWKSGHAQSLRRHLPSLIRTKPLVALWTLLQASEVLLVLPLVLTLWAIYGVSWEAIGIGVLGDFVLLYVPAAIGCAQRRVNLLRALAWYPCWWFMKVWNLEADLRHWVPEFLGLRTPFSTYEMGH